MSEAAARPRLSATQRAIYFAAPAVGWLGAAAILRDAGLPKSAAPRIVELHDLGCLRRQKRAADGRWEYQRVPLAGQPGSAGAA